MSEEPRPQDEMRPITALFADIVGSTGLGERLGPDEVKALVGECVTRMSRAVEDFGGVIQAFMGDGICAYFGVPAAHEDDPERAARAALRIIGVAAGYAGEVEAAWGIEGFNVRVGVNSGPAAVGLVGGEDSQTVALGDTTNVAARLQSAAEPGSIAIGPGTASRLDERFVLEPLGEVTVKGRSEPVSASRLVGPRLRHRAALPHAPGRSRARARAARDGGRRPARGPRTGGARGRRRRAGQDEDARRARVARGRGRRRLEGRCVSYGAGSPYGPFVELLRTWLGVEETDTELAVRTKLRARAGALLGAAQDRTLPYLGLMLSIRLEQDVERELLALSADELSDRVQDAFVLWAEALGATRPLVLAIDDLHWADRTTRDLAERLLALTDRSAVMLATALRPDPGSQGWAFRLEAQTRFAHRVDELSLAAVAGRGRPRADRRAGPPRPGRRAGQGRGGRQGRGQPALPRGAAARAARDRRRPSPDVDDHAEDRRRAPAGARGAARGPHRPARTRRATARAGRRGRRTGVPGLGRRAVAGQRRRRHRRAPARRDRPRGPSLPRARVHVPTRPAPGGRARRPSRRPRNASCTDASGTRWRRTWATRSTNVSNSWRSTSTGATRPTRGSRTSNGPPSTRRRSRRSRRAEQLWERERRLAERVGDRERVEHVDRQLAWLRKRSDR